MHNLGKEDKRVWAGVKAGKKNLSFVFAMPKLPAEREAKLCRKKLVLRNARMGEGITVHATL